jgi:hypothetical protein
MAVARHACWACVALLGLLAPAAASARAGTHEISILAPDGRVQRHALLGARGGELAPAPPAGRPHPARPRARLARARTVISELARMRRAGQIAPADAAQRRRAYEDARRTLRRLSGTRRRELQAVLGTIAGIAARGRLTPSRLAPLWLTLERNREWWTTAPWVPAVGERVGFQGDELVYQYYAGQGLQIQWLGTFGKLNALAKSAKAANAARASAMIDQILPLASARAGGLAWEYEFAFGGGGGAPPWTSSLSQGTGLQALARAAQQTGREAEVLPVTNRALAVFRRRTPEGVRVPVPGGVHYAQYSFAPGLRILNGFVQSVVGLHDYAEISGNARAEGLYEAGLREAEREVPAYDTGAWSLYSRGTSSSESNLNYHVLLRDFLTSLCQRSQGAVFCDTAQRFTDDLKRPPVVTIPAQRLRARTTSALRLKLDKISALTVRVARGGRVVLARYLGTVGHGERSVPWVVPRRRGAYTVTVTARDLAGNAGTARGTVQVVGRPRG